MVFLSSLNSASDTRTREGSQFFCDWVYPVVRASYFKANLSTVLPMLLTQPKQCEGGGVSSSESIFCPHGTTAVTNLFSTCIHYYHWKSLNRAPKGIVRQTPTEQRRSPLQLVNKPNPYFRERSIDPESHLFAGSMMPAKLQQLKQRTYHKARFWILIFWGHINPHPC